MIGELIKKRRLELGMTQEELAKRLGYAHKSSINKLEMNKNDVTQTLLLKISDALDVSPMYFINQIDVPHETHSRDAIMEYARKLARLNQADLDNVIKYIDFLESQQKKGE